MTSLKKNYPQPAKNNIHLFMYARHFNARLLGGTELYQQSTHQFRF